MKIKLTNQLLEKIEALHFEHIVVGIDTRGDLIIKSNVDETASNKRTFIVKDYILRDRQDKGLAIRISPNSVSFFVQRKMGGSESVKRSLGIYRKGIATVADARTRAQIWLGLMADGRDPFAERILNRRKSNEVLTQQRLTFGVVYQKYIDTLVNGSSKSKKARELVKRWMDPESKKDATKDERKKNKNKKAPPKTHPDNVLWGTPFLDVTEETVRKSLQPWFDKDTITGEFLYDIASGWKILRCCQAAYALHVNRPKMQDEKNPFRIWRKRANPPKVKPRTSYLDTKSNRAEIWLKELISLRGHSEHTVNVVADFVVCVLLWGGRKTETQLVKIEDVDFEKDTVTFKSENTKNQEIHVFPLTPWAKSILLDRLKKNEHPRWSQKSTDPVSSGNWVFASRVRGKHIVDIRNVLRKCQVASGLEIGAHDLRRTFAKELAGDSKNVMTVKVAMNHSDARNDVTVQSYIQDKIDLLRPLYEAREKRLMRLAGVISDDTATLTSDALDSQINELLQNPEAKEALIRRLLMSKN